MRRSSPVFILFALATCGGCAIDVALENPMRYREVDASHRIRVPCYYALDSDTESLVVSSSIYRAEMGPAIANQLRAALGGLCRGTGRLLHRNEFLTFAEPDEPAILFEVSATAEITWSQFFGFDKGLVKGQAQVTGPSGSFPLQYQFEGRGEYYPSFGETSTNTEGLREALGKAIQKLVDQAQQDRVKIEELARSQAPADAQ